MGISERDYARVGPRSASGLGSLRMISFNTWLIVINVAVFVVNNWLLSPKPLLWTVSYGTEYSVTASPEQRARGRELNVVYLYPYLHGAWYHPIVDPRAPPGEPGPRVEEPVTHALLLEIGRRRYGEMPALEALGHFSTGKAFGAFELWRFITFQFLHANLMHLVFNMLGLWFVGGLVEQYLGFKRYAAFYLVCGVFGALMYLLLNFLGYIVGNVMGYGPVRVPGLLFNDVYTPLVGASAGVFGVLIAAAFVAPNSIVYVYFAIPMRLRTAVYLLMGITLVDLFRGALNAGGEAAHVGGALAGFYFIRHTHLLRDFFDVFGNTGRTARRGGGSGGGGEQNEEVDRILAKVAVQGLASLNEAEKRTLRQATEAQQRV